MALTKPDRDILAITAGMKAGTELTIAAGAITLVENAHPVDTEADAASDDLDTINAGPAPDGALAVLYAADTTRTVVVKHGTGNIQIQNGGDITLDDANKSVLLRRDGANWRDVVTAVGNRGVVQIVFSDNSNLKTGTAIMPLDNTVPQSTEGDEIFSASITPRAPNSRLLVEAVINLGVSALSYTTVALFQGTAVNALAAVSVYHPAANAMAPIVLRHRVNATSTASTTFKIRAGMDRAGTTTLNGFGGAAKLGGSLLSSITITEIATIAP